MLGKQKTRQRHLRHKIGPAAKAGSIDGQGFLERPSPLQHQTLPDDLPAYPPTCSCGSPSDNINRLAQLKKAAPCSASAMA